MLVFIARGKRMPPRAVDSDLSRCSEVRQQVIRKRYSDIAMVFVTLLEVLFRDRLSFCDTLGVLFLRHF